MGNARRPSFRGCCAMCALQTGKIRGLGRAKREPPRDLRARGKRRRVMRREVPTHELTEVR